MKATLDAIARRPQVKRDVRELILLSGGDPGRVIDIAVRRLGIGGTGKPQEIEAAAWHAYHLLRAQEPRS